MSIGFFFVVNVGCTLFLTGVIWFVQVVHYPLFSHIGVPEFSPYHLSHERRTTQVVVIPMVGELGTAFLLAWRPPPFMKPSESLFGVALVLVIWVATALVQIPQHKNIKGDFSVATVSRLVLGNWVRTVAWSVRAGLLLGILARVVR